MATRVGLRDIALTGASVASTITYATPQETLQGTPTALPTSTPASNTFAYTVQAADLPVIVPAVRSVVYVAMLVAGGRNTDSVSRNVTAKNYLNGVLVTSGTTTVAAGQYWTCTVYTYTPVVVGDSYGLRLSAAAAAVTWDYQAFQVLCTRINPVPAGDGVLITEASTTLQPTLTLGVPAVASTGIAAWRHADGADLTSWPVNGSTLLPFVSIPRTRGIMGLIYGDSTSGINLQTDATRRPYHYQDRTLAGWTHSPLRLSGVV